MPPEAKRRFEGAPRGGVLGIAPSETFPVMFIGHSLGIAIAIADRKGSRNQGYPTNSENFKSVVVAHFDSNKKGSSGGNSTQVMPREVGANQQPK